ncbi:carbonyl reductase [NADPH] 1-like [Tribolium madens]|uniref:carbonyl reductase [NADPH] 1-like n=1 Tax=Tribolium madens TaxID=41895 RepID=UPI001CF75B02|nr:carbonyl reductase [NADPH] 1-like [Tribolium madens]
MSVQKVALVTGGNKGIGYAIVKGLCEKFQGVVYLTARDVGRGEAAVGKLKELGFNPLFHQLDINDQNSITKLKNHLVEKHGGLDLVVNNAAIAFKNDAPDPFSEQAETTVAVNYFSLLRVCETLFPILRQNARVVNLSSSAGHLSRIPSPNLRAKFSDPNLTIPQLNKLMEQFVQDAKANKHQEAGWGTSAYVVSKVGVSALTRIQQREFDKETPNRNISVNSVHPGYVDTDMTSHKGPWTIEQGARAPLFLALEAENLKGQYIWSNAAVAQWDADKPTATV